MRWKLFVAGILAAAAAYGAGIAVGFGTAQAELREMPPPPEPPRDIDAAQISSGRIAVTRMPSEVTSAIALHSQEIAKTAESIGKTAELLETRQARIRGTCPPGAAIRAVLGDGTVLCQRIAGGVVSVSALTGVARRATTKTTQGAVGGVVGRYQIEGDEDFIIVPVQLPDGAVVTSFSYTAYDDSTKVDSEAYLYRSDDMPLAVVATEGASKAVTSVSTDEIDSPRVDNKKYAYFVYMRMSPLAYTDLMPVGASVRYRLP